ncbi:MAG TPA: AMP-binding protein [Thermoanaerobaculia bacterium]
MPETVVDVLEATARAHPQRPAMRIRLQGRWQTTTWQEYRDQAFLAARGFLKLGLAAGNGVVILGYNRPEWFLADMAAIAAGGLPAGIYTNSTPEQCHYIAEHAEAAIAVVENEAHLATFLALRDRLPKLRAIVLMTGTATEAGVYTWQQLLDLGASVPAADLTARIAAQKPEDVCTLIYTSGTTGPPKAVALTHRNIVWTTARLVESYGVTAEDEMLSYLPLSHIAEQVVSLHTPMAVGGCSWFAESLEKLRDNLVEVRPNVFFAVPRVWEKMQAAIQAAGAQNSGLKKKIAAWARGVGTAAGHAQQAGRARPLLYPLADKLVFSKVRQRLGLDRARVLATSTAPISVETLDFFSSLGLPILEVYGMSECTGPTTFSIPERYRLGSVGFAIPGSEIRIADNGEVLLRGPHVFKGYHKNPEATREALDGDGWLHTGDVGEIDGEIDGDGFLRITDRIKELLITSGGKNIGPQILEGKLRQIPAVSQAVVIGDRRNYLAALLTLDPQRAPQEAEIAGSPFRTPRELAACAIFHRYLEGQVEAVNATLARYETIKKYAILPAELSIEEGELTPTMKLKRRVVYQKYAAEIESLYR